MAIASLIFVLLFQLISISHSTLYPTATSTATAASFTPPSPLPPQQPHFSISSPKQPLYRTSPPQQPLYTTSQPQQAHFAASSPLQQSPHDQDYLQDQAMINSRTSHLASLLSHLGFNELAAAAPYLSSTDSTTTGVTAALSGPYTIFAPSDASVRTCISCVTLSILREHIVRGLLTADYLRKLTFGTKIETLSTGRCIAVTSTAKNDKNFTVHKMFIGGVEITHPDLFNNGLIIIHGLQGYISPLSPFSCEVERMTSLSFPFHERSQTNQFPPLSQNAASPMRLMLRDAIVQLKTNGFAILSIAMKIKYAELVPLNNVTIFALDDTSIFSTSYSYVNNLRFHIVPNQYLTAADLERLPVGTTLTTLDRGSLVVTTAGVGIMKKDVRMRINYVRFKVVEVIKNYNVIVHSIHLPFPRLNPTAAMSDAVVGGGGRQTGSTFPGTDHMAFEALDQDQGGCKLAPASQATTPVKTNAPEIEDHDGL